ncbi:unnamed protein product, partial [Brassica oleracea var. botrytis]
MADSSSSRPPLCERISHKSYFLRAVDLTILGLLFSLLLYRIQRVNENETVWVVLCESCFLFIWLLITCIKWSPAEYKPHLHRLDKRYPFLVSDFAGQTEYEKLSRKVEDATGDYHWLDSDDDFEAFSNTKPTDHSTIVKLVCENKEGVGDEKEVPHFVYISREKRENYHHHYKAGAMNFLVRVSGLMTNAPYMLNVDCDMYVNEADEIPRKNVIWDEELRESKDRYLQALDVFTLEKLCTVFLDLDDSGSLSSVATKRMLAEGSLAREFGSSKEIVKSVVEELQGKSNPQQTITNSIEIAEEVGNCHYEYQTSWGKTYWNPFERMDKLIHFSRSTSISRLYAANGTGGHGPVAAMGDRHARSLFQQTKSVDGTISPKNKIQTTSGLHFHFYVGSKGLCLGIIVTLLGMHCLYTLWEFMRVGFSVQSCILDITLKLIGISKVVLIVTQKTMPESRSGSGDEPPQRIDHGLSPSSGKFEIDGSLYFLPGTFIVLVNLAAITGYWVGLQSWSCKDGGGGSGLAEAC